MPKFSETSVTTNQTYLDNRNSLDRIFRVDCSLANLGRRVAVRKVKQVGQSIEAADVLVLRAGLVADSRT